MAAGALGRREEGLDGLERLSQLAHVGYAFDSTVGGYTCQTPAVVAFARLPFGRAGLVDHDRAIGALPVATDRFESYEGIGTARGRSPEEDTYVRIVS